MTSKNSKHKRTAGPPIPSVSETRWFDADGHRLSGTEGQPSSVYLNWLKTYSPMFRGTDSKLIVGTDSHVEGRTFKFVTTICLYQPTVGGNYICGVTYEDRANFRGNPTGRMFKEVQYSVELAEKLFTETGLVPDIHIDASPPEANEFTSPISAQLQGYAASYGFPAFIKPESWAATHLADRHTR